MWQGEGVRKKDFVSLVKEQLMERLVGLHCEGSAVLCCKSLDFSVGCGGLQPGKTYILKVLFIYKEIY